MCQQILKEDEAMAHYMNETYDRTSSGIGTRNAKQTILRASGHVAWPRSILAWIDRVDSSLTRY